MASPAGVSSLSSTLLQHSGSEEGVQQQLMVVDQKNKKRKLSNRESARRSRIRKQNHMEELGDEVNQLKKLREQLKANLNFTRQLCMSVEAETAILQTQMTELRHRLGSLTGIINYTRSLNSSIFYDEAEAFYHQISDFESFFIMDPGNHLMSACANIFMY